MESDTPLNISSSDNERSGTGSETEFLSGNGVEVVNDLLSEQQALHLLDPLDQVYSPRANLQGISFVYRFITQSVKSFVDKKRNNLPTKKELKDVVYRDQRTSENLESILEYLVKKSDANPLLACTHYAAVFENDELTFQKVYIAGERNAGYIMDRSDQKSAEYLIQEALDRPPWEDADSYRQSLAEKIASEDIKGLYIEGYFKFSFFDDSSEARMVFENRVLPQVRKKEEIYTVEIPPGMRFESSPVNAIQVVNNRDDIIIRYEYFSERLIGYIDEYYKGRGEEIPNRLKNSFQLAEEIKSPENIRRLAGEWLQEKTGAAIFQQIAAELFLLREKAEEILRWIQERSEETRKRQVEAMVRRIKSRNWLVLMPVQFYPEDVFHEAIKGNGIYGIHKDATSLLMDQDYYCIIEEPVIPKVLEKGNMYEIGIVEDIINQCHPASINQLKKQLYRKKKNLLFLIINPFLYLLRSILPGKKSFINKMFRRQFEANTPELQKSQLETIKSAGIKADPTTLDVSRRGGKRKLSEKEKLAEFVLSVLFPDADPTARIINDIEYKTGLGRAAKLMKGHPDFPQYKEKEVESIIVDIEPFIKKHIIEDIYEGSLPAGRDFRGRKFTRKTYSPKDICNYPIIYNNIYEEMEHEGSLYGTKDIAAYYRAKCKVYSEENMSKVRYEMKLKGEAESRQSGDDVRPVITTPSAKTTAVVSAKPSPEPEPKKASTKGVQSADQKIARAVSTLTKELDKRYGKQAKYSGGELFPPVNETVEKALGLTSGNLSLFMAQNSKAFIKNFVVIKVGLKSYFFPRRFFSSKQKQIAKFYDDLVRYEERLPLPNGEIIASADAIANAVKLKRS